MRVVNQNRVVLAGGGDHFHTALDTLHRGQGIGKAIYQEIIRYAQVRKVYNVTLNVWCCNPSAMKFYEALVCCLIIAIITFIICFIGVYIGKKHLSQQPD